MRSLVTGGAGFIGSHLVDALLGSGDDVVAFDNLSSGNRGNLDGALAAGAELVLGDVTDAPAVASLFADAAPDRVFHLAAQVDVRRAVADPQFDAEVNVVGTINVLEAARPRRTPIVLASTGGAIYGEGEGRDLPLDESSSCRPEAPYGMSKLAAEGYLDVSRRVHGVPGVALRLGNVYGPRQDPHGEAGVIAIFAGRLLAGEAPVVYGDGLQTRDYVYATDVVDAFKASAERLGGEASGLGAPINVATGVETTVLELVQLMGSLLPDGAAEPSHEESRAGEVARISLDCERARRELGWQPRMSLSDGLEATLASVRSGSRAG
ncbi:MAG: GDP-mannose 4,6-dehydratase [Solirubrobacterales bacterium]